MFRRKNNNNGVWGEGFSKSLENIGSRLYRIHGENASKALDAEARTIKQTCLAQSKTCEEQIGQLEEKLANSERDLNEQLEVEQITVEKAKANVRSAVFRLVLANLMVVVSICIIAWSLGPFFYGNDVLWIIVSIGIGLSIFVCMEQFFGFIAKIFNRKQFFVFHALIAAVVVGFFIVGFVQLSEVRAILIKVQQMMQADTIQFDQDLVDVEAAKQEINDLARRAMVFLFLGFEWMTGVLFYFSGRNLRKYNPISKMAIRRANMILAVQGLREDKGFLGKLDTQIIKSHLRKGIERERTKGNFPVMIAIIIIIAGICLGSFFFADSAFGGVFDSENKEPTYFLVGFDITGSTDHDRRENERAIIKIINSLKPGDEFQLINITQATFSAPEYMLHYEMPLRAGYFKEEIRRAKLRIVHEFRSLCERLPRSRKATSIIEGLVMFSHLLQERNRMKRKLILISDMLQFSKNLNPAKISTNGEKVLRMLKSEGLIPDMRGIDVYVMGASTAGVDAKTWKGVKEFWAGYFQETGANLRCYSIQRTWPLK